MANQSIYAGFERMWQHTSSAIGAKADKEEVVGVVYAKEDEGTDSSVPVNADTLGGRPADDYATQAFISNLDIIYAYDEDSETTVAPVDADTLGGRPASDFALAHDVENITIESLGAAPAGFGLGASCQNVSDWNNATESGFIQGSINAPTEASWYGYVIRHGVGYVIQVAFTLAYGSRFWQATRVMYNGTWQPWEWVNPPLDLNVEYLTTERYKGLPVYIKACELDLAPSGSKHVGFASGITNVVSIDGSIYNRTEGLVYHLSLHKDSMCMNSYGNLVFNVTENSLARVVMKYTK
jgi:hypothetical protein